MQIHLLIVAVREGERVVDLAVDPGWVHGREAGLVQRVGRIPCPLPRHGDVEVVHRPCALIAIGDLRERRPLQHEGLDAGARDPGQSPRSGPEADLVRNPGATVDPLQATPVRVVEALLEVAVDQRQQTR